MDYTAFKSLMDQINTEEWKKSHNTINLVVSVVSQSASLLESFKWAEDNKNSAEVIESRKPEIVDNIADIMASLIYLSYNLGIEQDTVEAFIYSKIIKEYSQLGNAENSENTANVKTVDFKHHKK